MSWIGFDKNVQLTEFYWAIKKNFFFDLFELNIKFPLSLKIVVFERDKMLIIKQTICRIHIDEH